MHHGALERKKIACPVKALARRVAHIWVNTSDGTKILRAYWEIVGRGDFTDSDMSFHMKSAAAKLSYPSKNIPLDMIDTHSKQAGGACTMILEGFDYESIRKTGRWLLSLNVFL